MHNCRFPRKLEELDPSGAAVTVVNCLPWVLGIELASFGRALQSPLHFFPAQPRPSSALFTDVATPTILSDSYTVCAQALFPFPAEET